MRRTVGQHLRHRRLEAGGDVGRVLRRQRSSRVSGDDLRHRGLQPGEAEIAARAAQQRAREGEAGGVAPGGQAFQRRAARPAQAEHLGHLVERLAHRVVDRAAEPAVTANAFNRDALAMPAGHQQQQIGERGPAPGHARQPRGQCMRLQVVDRQERQAAGDGDALAEAAAHDQPADQPGPGGRGDGAKIGVVQPRLANYLGNQGRQMRQMGAGGDFRHHAAEARVLRLAQHRLGQDAAIGVQDRRGGLVATAFDPQHWPEYRPRHRAFLSHAPSIGRRHDHRPTCGSERGSGDAAGAR